MKKVLLFVLLLGWLSALEAQVIVNRAGAANTVSDARLQGGLNFFTPRYADTLSANTGTNRGIDSVGAVIFTRDLSSLWQRVISTGTTKKWVQILNSGGGIGSGTLTNWLFTNANGFVGSVLNPTTVPNLTLTTNLTQNTVPYANSAGGLVSVGINATGTGKYLHQVSSGIPSFQEISASDLPDSSGNYIWNSTIQQPTSNYNISGAGVIGTTLTIGSVASGAVTDSVLLRIGSSGLVRQTTFTEFTRRLDSAIKSTGSYWHTLGNAGTTAGTNFVGTTDNIDLVLKRSGAEGLRLVSMGITLPASRIITWTGENTITSGFTAGGLGKVIHQAVPANTGTAFWVIPKGTPTVETYQMGVIQSEIGLLGNDFVADPANFSKIIITNAAGGFGILSYREGTGVHKPLIFGQATLLAKSEFLRIDTNSNIVIPPAPPIVDTAYDLLARNRNTGVIGYAPRDPLSGLTSGSAWQLIGNTLASPGTMFLGTLSNNSLRLRTNNTQYAILDSLGRFGIGTNTPSYVLDVTGRARITDTTRLMLVPPGAATDSIMTIDIATGRIRARSITVGTGSVTNVSGTEPIQVATGTTTPIISMKKASATDSGWVSITNQIFGGQKTLANPLLTGLSNVATSKVLRWNSTTGAITWADTTAAQAAYTASNGLTMTGNNTVFGGPLIQNTSVTGASTYNLTLGTLGSKLVNFESYSTSSTNFQSGTSEVWIDGANSKTMISSGSGANYVEVSSNSIKTVASGIYNMLVTNAGVYIGSDTSGGGTSGVSAVLNMRGITNGTVSVKVQPGAGTYNFNLPIIPGTVGWVLTSQGGGSAAMTWTDLSGLGGGTVMSVGLALPSEITVTGSPVTTSGTLTGAWANQTAYKVFGRPSGTGVPSFISLDSNHISGFSTYVRPLLSLTTTGTSGAATYNNLTGVTNIPQYATDISGKLNISDTSAMLTPYLRTAGDLSPLFTTAESSHNIAFTLSNTVATYKVFGSPTAGAPSFISLDTNYIANFSTMVRPLLSLTTSGTSGAATYNNVSGIFNIPQYQAAGNYITALTGDGTATGPGSVAFTLATVNANVGTWNNLTVNGKGLVTAGSNVAYLTTNQTITLSGDVTGSGTTAITTAIGANKVTLAMMAQMATASFLGRNTAAIGNVEVLSIATAKTMLNLAGSNNGDQTTSGTTNRITVTSGTTNPVVDIAATYVGQASLTTLGTIATGVWNGTIITVPYGGTGVGTLASNGVLYGNGTGVVQALAVNSTATNKFLTQISSGVPAWNTMVAGDVPALANLSATDATLTFSGTYNTTTARTIGLNLANANTWTGLATFNNTGGTIFDALGGLEGLIFKNSGTQNGFISSSASYMTFSSLVAQGWLWTKYPSGQNVALLDSTALFSLGASNQRTGRLRFFNVNNTNQVSFNGPSTPSTNLSFTLPSISGTLFGDGAASFTSAQLLGALTDETGTGVAVFSTSPTFTTQITSPLIYGGPNANDDITIQGTLHATKTTSYVNMQTTGGNVGIGNTTPLAKLHVTGGLLVEGATGTNPLNGAGTRLVWIPNKSTLVAATATGVNLDTDSLGSYSIVTGYDNKSGAYYGGGFQAVFGRSNTALNNYSIVAGQDNYTSALHNVALGNGNIVMANAGAAIGSNDTISLGGNAGMALGQGNRVYFHSGIALGYYLSSTRTDQVVVGSWNDTTAQGTNAQFVVGVGTSNTVRYNALSTREDGETVLGQNGYIQGSLSMVGSTSGIFTQKTPAVAGTWTHIWPAAAAAVNGYVLAGNTDGTSSWVVQGGGSGANTALSNLAAVAINTTLLPGVSGTPDLGSGTFQFGSVFLEEGGAVNWDNGDATLTQVANNVTLAGASLVTAAIDGGIAANDDITINGTQHATKTTSYVNLQTGGGFVGIGTTTPDVALNIAQSGLTTQFMMDSYNTSGSNRSILFFRTATGTEGSPGNVGLSNTIGEFIGSGYAGSAFRNVTEMGFRVDASGTISASSLPAEIYFSTTPDGSVTRVERMYVKSDGTIKIVNLAGTGSRAVIADVNGVLSAPVSDQSVKFNISPLENGIEKLMQLKPVTFEYIKGWKNYGVGTQIGFIAQEVEKVLPNSTFTTKSTGKMGYNISDLIPVLTLGLKETYTEVQELKKIIDDLKARIEKLENDK